MRNLSIEQFYEEIDKRILLVAAFSEIPKLDLIIRACRMKPLSAFSRGFDAGINKLERDWIDEFGTCLHYNKEYKSWQLVEDKPISQHHTDLFGSRSPRWWADRSDWMAASPGKISPLSPDNDDSNWWLLLRCKDGFIRAWHNGSSCSPLVGGLAVVRHLLESSMIRERLGGMEWVVTKLPPSRRSKWLAGHPALKEIVYTNG